MNSSGDMQGVATELLLTRKQDGVTTLTMNNPARLNGWTQGMMDALKQGLNDAAADDGTRVLVLTGADPYYCAGVNLSSIIRPMHPRRLHALIVKYNQAGDFQCVTVRIAMKGFVVT